MKRIFTVFLLLSILFSFPSFAYQPTVNIDSLQNRALRSSDIIFLGEIINLDSVNENVTYRIIEIFKGSNKSSEIKIEFGEYSPFPTIFVMPSIHNRANSGSKILYSYSKGIWLVYANSVNDSVNIFNVSRLSRSLQHADNLFIWPYILIEQTEKGRSDLSILSQNDWVNELIKLMDFKRINENKDILVQKNKTAINTCSYIAIILGIISSVLLIFLLIKLIRK